jgi:hypothetical protein
MAAESSIRALSAIRLAVGAGAWLTPRLAGRAFMLDPAGNPQSPYLARLFGIRDVALAYGTQSAQGEARRTWLTAGLACDVADTLAALAGGRAGYLSRTQTVLLAAPAIAATALGAAALSAGDADGV